jgi:hypothetical protein
MERKEGEVAAEVATVLQSAHDAAVTKAKTDGVAEGEKTGSIAARARVKTILTSEHAKGRDALAQHLAFDTDMTAEAAVAMLEKSPKGQTAPGIAERMQGQGTDLAMGRPVDAPKSAAACWDKVIARRHGQKKTA